jgi:hypothetical protein
MAAILGNALSASCHCHLIEANLRFSHAAAELFAMDVFMPMPRAT